MNIDEILNMIDDMLEEAWSLPFSGGRCVVDAQKVKECVEDIRLNLPGEIKQAKTATILSKPQNVRQKPLCAKQKSVPEC